MVSRAVMALLRAAATLLLVSFAVFVSLQLVPGGYADIVLGPFATPSERAALSEQYGLDDPVLIQYVRWLGEALQGNLGTSLRSGDSVASEVGRRLPATLEVMLLALLLSVVVGYVLGLAAGLARSRRTRSVARVVGTMPLSIPDFVLGTVLVYLFSSHAWGLTVGSYVPFSVDPMANLRAVVLPSLTLGLFGIGLVMRTQRDATMEVLTQPYITAAVARGEAGRTVVRRHVLRNSSPQVVTVIAILLGSYVSGTVIVETLFSVPGIGSYFVVAVRARDFAVVQGVVLLSAGVFVVANMLADFMYSVIDPRRGNNPSEAR
jgi:peptide/nickel transport system permease protein